MSEISLKKAGIKTTEFWATILGTIVVGGAAELGIHLQVESIIGVVAMVVTYVFGRVLTKNSSK